MGLFWKEKPYNRRNTVCRLFEKLNHTFFYYQVVFEGVRGVNIAGDIAIDDVSMTNGLCSCKKPYSCRNFISGNDCDRNKPTFKVFMDVFTP